MSILRTLADSFREKSRQTDFWLHCSLFLFLGAAFWPLTAWLVQTANDQSRIFHALIVLTMASVLLIRFNGVSVVKTLEFNRPSRHALMAAYGLLLLNYVAQLLQAPTELGLLILPAYCCGLAAVVLFVFGADTRRITITVASTLCVFLFISIWMAPLDWPLRSLAGLGSGQVLELLGQTTDLGLLREPDSPPMLILLVNDYPFHVASECNGFGVILTSLLIALLLAIFRRLSAVRFALSLLVGVTIGFVFNILRIVIIILLAPSLMEHYHFMHETVGGITYWACLIIVWLVMKGPTRPKAPAGA